MTLIVGHVFGIGKDIIEIDHHTGIKNIGKDIVYKLLEGYRNIGKDMSDVEKYNCLFKWPIASMESSFSFIIWLKNWTLFNNTNKIVAMVKVNSL